MAIIKHISSQNKFFSDVVTYLSMQHNEDTGDVLFNSEGEMLERSEYLIQGINCTPEDFAERCLVDRLRFGVKAYDSEIMTHQYIISFDPNDKEKGLTLKKAQEQGLCFAKKYFSGHRVIVCAHPDGASHSGNIHVHIIISALRFENRLPEERYMRLRPDGRVKTSEYKAGCRHQDTARLRLHMQAYLEEFCRQNGFTVTSSHAKRKVNNQEYKAGIQAQKQLEQDNALRIKNGIKPAQMSRITHKEELRRVIADAAMSTSSWDSFLNKLQFGYTRPVEHRADTKEISYPIKRELWKVYKNGKEAFWKSHKSFADSYSIQLEQVFQMLRTHQSNKTKSQRNHALGKGVHNTIIKELCERISILKSKQQKLRLVAKVYQIYSKAAALALSNEMEEDARICLAKMEVIANRIGGRTTYTLDKKDGNSISWLQTKKEELDEAEAILSHIQRTLQQSENKQPEISEEPFPIDVKLTRGVISFKHPDMEHWVRGRTLGRDFELTQIKNQIKNNTYAKATFDK